MTKVPIIGIGASAGGLKELKAFFKSMPSIKDAAFVIIQHLSPSYKSILAEIVTRYTQMEVSQIENKTLVEVGKVYIIPPNKQLTLKNGKLILTAIPKEQKINLPIDIFFRSLKENLGEKAVAVVLSGTGSDGSSGIKEVKEAGGLTIVQQPDTADYDGMPLSAIKTGLIDFVIPVEEMPKVIIDYIDNEFKEKKNLNDDNKVFDNHVPQILEIIKLQTGNDFSQYKKNTIYRRIDRRIQVNKLGSVKEYIKLLETNSTEVGILYKEFLISVTCFF